MTTTLQLVSRGCCSGFTPVSVSPGCWAQVWYTPEDDPARVKQLLRYTLSLGVTTALSAGHLELFETLAQAVEGEMGALSEAEEAELLAHYAGAVPVFPQGAGVV